MQVDASQVGVLEVGSRQIGFGSIFAAGLHPDAVLVEDRGKFEEKISVRRGRSNLRLRFDYGRHFCGLGLNRLGYWHFFSERTIGCGQRSDGAFDFRNALQRVQLFWSGHALGLRGSRILW